MGSSSDTSAFHTVAGSIACAPTSGASNIGASSDALCSHPIALARGNCSNCANVGPGWVIKRTSTAKDPS